jgi:DNA polymerase-3 subunit epsilon
LDKYPEELENDVKYLSDYSKMNNNVDFAGRFVYNDEGVEVFNFGKYKGLPVTEVLKREPGYYSWMMQGDFPLNTKRVLSQIRARGNKQNG